MRTRADHPLAYPAATSVVALLVCVVLAIPANADQRAALTAVALAVVVFSAFQLTRALRGVRLPEGEVRRVRQEHRLISRSWLEIAGEEWIPVYFDPALLTEANPRALRLYPSGGRRDSEPVGRLIDNPSRPDADTADRASRAARWGRRILLDAQSAVAAPFAALLWVYLAAGGVLDFLAAALVAAVGAVWLGAVRGSDPS